MEITKNGLKKPSPEDFYNIEVFNENMDIIEEFLEKGGSGGGNSGLDISVTSDMWLLDETTSLYKATITWNGITSNHVVDVVFDLQSLDKASDVKNYTESGTDCFYLYSDSVIADTLTGAAYAKVVK